MDITTRNFYRLLRAGAFDTQEQIEPISAWKWKRIYQLSLLHGVSALMYDGLTKCSDQFFLQLPDGLRDEWEKTTLKTEACNKQADEQLRALFHLFKQQQLRPVLLKGEAQAVNYRQPLHRFPTGIDIFFPFETQGKKADKWAQDHAKSVVGKDRHVLAYEWNGCDVKHYHRMQQLTNKVLNHALQNIIEKDFRETPPTYIYNSGEQIETISYNLSLLLLILRITVRMLNDGMLLNEIVDMGVFLRKVGDKVDFVLLQEWIDKLALGRVAQLLGALLVGLFEFTPDEIPFMSTDRQVNITRFMQELFQLQQSERDEWFFQQGNGIFVHTANKSAMFWQMQHSLRYFRYYPSESFTNLFAAFAHSLSHIEE